VKPTHKVTVTIELVVFDHTSSDSVTKRVESILKHGYDPHEGRYFGVLTQDYRMEVEEIEKSEPTPDLFEEPEEPKEPKEPKTDKKKGN